MGRPARISRDQVLETARRVFTLKGFDATTLSDIAVELGVTAAALLRHVESKQALFHEAMSSGDIVAPPQCILDLATIDPASDPRVVLRRIAEEFVPFVQGVIATRVVMAMHANAQRTSLVLPFDPKADNAPRRGFRIVTDYFKRASEAGVIRVRDPRAAALLFMGSLQGYVLSQEVLKVAPALPLRDYVDALIDLWSHGAIGGTRARSKSNRRQTSGARDRGVVADRGRAAVRAKATPAKGSRSERNARSTNGQRRVARRRTRGPRSDR